MKKNSIILVALMFSLFSLCSCLYYITVNEHDKSFISVSQESSFADKSVTVDILKSHCYITINNVARNSIIYNLDSSQAIFNMPHNDVRISLVSADVMEIETDADKSNPTIENNRIDSLSSNGDTLIWVNKSFEGTYSIKKGVQVIRHNAFRDCGKITKITISNTVSEIENEAFSWCVNLQSVILPEGLKTIGHKVFSYCKSLKEIIIPNSISEIGDNPIYGANENLKIKSNNTRYIVIRNHFFVDSVQHKLVAYNGSDDIIEIPSVIKVIGKYAFAKNDYLQCVESNYITEIMNYAFYNCGNSKRFKFPNVQKIGNNPFIGIHSAPEIILDNNKYVYRDNLLVDKEKRYLICYVGNNEDVDLYIRNIHRNSQLKTVGNCSFFGCSFIKRIKLPNSVIEVEDNAFRGCLLNLVCSESTKNNIEGRIKLYNNKITFTAQ